MSNLKIDVGEYYEAGNGKIYKIIFDRSTLASNNLHDTNIKYSMIGVDISKGFITVFTKNGKSFVSSEYNLIKKI